MKTNPHRQLNSLPGFIRSAPLGLFLLVSAGYCAATTITWTGAGADANWSTPGNWTPGAPNPGDALVFDGSLQLMPFNNLAPGTVFTGLSFAPTASGFSLEGNAIGLAGLVANESGAPQIIDLSANLGDLTTFSNAASADLNVSGAVTTTTNFLKLGDGRLDLNWNWFANTTNNGTLTVSNGVVGINNGATSSSPGSQVNFNPRLTMSGGALELNYASYWNAPTILFTTNTSVGVSNGLRNDFAGTMGSPGFTWTKTGSGTLNTSFWETNLMVVQASAIVVAEGTLSDLPNNDAWDTNDIAQWGGSSVPITVAPGAAVAKGDCGIVLNPIELQGGDGTGNGNGALYAYRINNGTGVYPTISFLNTITLDNDSTIGSLYGILVLAGPVVGPGGLVKVGANPLVLAGTNSYAGTTTINVGVLQLGSAAAIPVGSGKGNLQLNGSTTLDLNANNATVANLSDDSSAAGTINNSGAAPATLTVGANDQPVSFTGAIRNTGAALSIVKIGSGVATLLGVNSYAGSNVVMGGSLELNIPTGPTANGMVLLADGTALTLRRTSGSSALKPTAVTLGTSGATTLTIDLDGFGNPASAVLNATNGSGTLIVGGNVTINIAGNGNVMAIGQFPLIKYLARAGSGTFTLGTLPTSIVATIVTNIPNSSIDLKITSAPITKWVGNVSSDWDINATMNWSVLGSPTKYQDGSGVLFDDTARTNFVNITTTVLPGGTVVSAATNYTFAGPGGIYAGDLTKSGNGTLLMLTANGYNNTIVSSGTVQVDNGGTSGSLGYGNIQNDATVVFNRADPINIPGNITGAGNLVQQGTNTLTLSGANGYAGGTQVKQGVVQLGQGMNQAAGSQALGIPAGTTPLATVANGAALDVNDTRISTLNNPVIISGPGTGVSSNVGALYSSGGGYTYFSSGTPPTVTNLQLAADASIGGVNDWFEIGSHGGTVGGIDGKNHVLTKVGSSTIILNQNAISSLSQAVLKNGRITITTGNPFGSSALVVLDGGALDTWGNGVAGWVGVTVPNNFQVTANGGAIRDTGNGNNAWYNQADVDTYNGTITINGPLTIQSQQTYSGGNNYVGYNRRSFAQMYFNGVLSGPGSVTKTGPTFTYLNGANTYTGPTTVSAGTLYTTTASQGGGAYTVNDGATLDVSAAAGFPTLPTASLTVGTATGATLSFARVLTLSSNALILATNLTVAGTCSILPPGWAYANPGQYPLVKYTGAVSGGGTWTVGGAGARGSAAYISNNAANSSIDLVVPAANNNALTWMGNINGNWDIATTANWKYNGSADYYQQNAIPGDAVVFDDTATGTTTVSNAAWAGLTPSLITFNNSAKNYTLNGFPGSSGSGTNLTGQTVLLKTGTGKLTINCPNDNMTGGTFINGGTIVLGNSSALNNVFGAGGIVTIDGGTLDLNNINNPQRLTINARGSGLGGLGAIVDNAASAANTYGPGTINMTGDLWIGGTNRWSMRNGAATLSCPTNHFTLYKVGPNLIDLAATSFSANVGDLVVLGGTLSYRNSNAGGLGSLAYKVKVGASGTFDYNSTPPVNLKPVICTNGATIAVSSSGVTVGNPITLDSGTVTFNANFNNTANFTNVISGAGGILVNYNSEITFSAVEAYTGNTEVRTGPYGGPSAYLKLSGVGSIASSPSIYLHGNGYGTNYLCGPILDASARSDGTLTLVSGQTFRGDTGSSVKGNVVASSGSTITPGGGYYMQTMAFSNNVTFLAGSTCVVDLNMDTATNDVFLVTGKITYGGTLQINHLGTSTFAPGQSFAVFSAGSYGGSFASITPATPGPNLAWDTSALVTSGTLAIVAVPYFLPVSLDPTGTHLIVQATNTMAGKSYILLSTTNLAPPEIWVPVVTNTPVNGVVSNALPVSASVPQEFYRYQMR
jgi:autotransporter-associated beta strand protein